LLCKNNVLLLFLSMLFLSIIHFEKEKGLGFFIFFIYVFKLFFDFSRKVHFERFKLSFRVFKQKWNYSLKKEKSIYFNGHFLKKLKKKFLIFDKKH